MPTFLRLILATFLIFEAHSLLSSSAPSSTRSVLSNLFSDDWRLAIQILLGILRLIAGLFILLGALTQVGALLALIIFTLRIITHTYREELVSTDLLLIVLSLALFALGPGLLSFDYPF